MENINKLKIDFSKKYPCFKEVEIEICPYNNLYVARCMADKIGDYILIKKGRIRNIIPRKIILTDAALKKKEDELLFIFIHECTHAITPQFERKVKNEYVRIDHSRLFYENFLELLNLAHKLKYIDYTFTDVKDLMIKDNRNENIKNDFKIYSKN